VRKDRNIEQSQDNHKERLRQKLESQLTMIENTIRDLMDGVDVKTLPLKERMLMTTRFIALYQHGISVEDGLGMNQKETRQNLAFSAIIRNLTSEKERESEREDFRFIDAEITAYSGIEDELEGEQKA